MYVLLLMLTICLFPGVSPVKDELCVPAIVDVKSRINKMAYYHFCFFIDVFVDLHRNIK